MNTQSETLGMYLEEYLSKLKREFYSTWNDSWKYTVQVSAKGTFLCHLFSELQNYPRFNKKSRRIEIVLNRLRIGHAGINQYLHRFGMTDGPLCSRCLVTESIDHFLLSCQKYTIARTRMLVKLRIGGIWPVTVKTLLELVDWCLPLYTT